MAKHTYTKETQYKYICGTCNKTWKACNFYDTVDCPHCGTRAVVNKTDNCEINKTCACRK